MVAITTRIVNIKHLIVIVDFKQLILIVNRNLKFDYFNSNRTLVDQYDKHSKYILEEMESTNDDYKLIKKSFKCAMYNWYTRYKYKAHKIYRVKQRITDETGEKKSDNMLLYHGTSFDGAVGVLEKGYKASTGGTYGPGVYLSASPSCSVSYSVNKTSRHGYYHGIISNSKKSSFTVKQKQLLNVFVNEVLESEKLKVVKCHWNEPYSSYYSHKYQFARYIDDETKEKRTNETYEKDSNGREIKTSRAKIRDEYGHYVCLENLVIPRYVIEFYSKVTLRF